MNFGKLFLFVGLSVNNFINGALEDTDLTPSQLLVLLFLLDCKREHRQVIQRDLERALHLKNPTVSGLLDRLERKGYLSRVQADDDRRIRVVQLSQKALSLREKANDRDDDLTKLFLRGFTEEEKQQLYGALVRVIQNTDDAELSRWMESEES